MALLNIRQSLGIHGCNGSVRYWEVDCTGDPEFELMSDIANGILDGKKLLELCPSLEPGHIIRINRIYPNGQVVPSGKSYTVVAKDTHYVYEERKKNFIYAVCHDSDKALLFQEIANVGEDKDYTFGDMTMGVFDEFGVLSLDVNPRQFTVTYRDCTNTNELQSFGGDSQFAINTPQGSVKVKERNYFSNRLIFRIRNAGGGDNQGKRVVLFSTFKPKEFLEMDFYNQNSNTQCRDVLYEYLIGGKLSRIFIVRWNSGALAWNSRFSLYNGMAGADSTNSVAWNVDFTIKTDGNEDYKGSVLSWAQTVADTNSVRLDAYGIFYFSPLVEPAP